MSRDRGLDARVSKLMGYDVFYKRPWRKLWRKTPWWEGDGTFSRYLPAYSSDPEAAKKIIKFLTEKGFEFNGMDVTTHVNRISFKKDKYVYTSTRFDSIEKAICHVLITSLIGNP